MPPSRGFSLALELIIIVATGFPPYQGLKSKEVKDQVCRGYGAPSPET